MKFIAILSLSLFLFPVSSTLAQEEVLGEGEIQLRHNRPLVQDREKNNHGLEEIDRKLKKLEEDLSKWSGRIDLGLGMSSSSASSKNTYSATVEPKITLNYLDVFQAKINMEIHEDVNDVSTDPEKLSTWFIANVDLEGMPIKFVTRDDKSGNYFDVYGGVILRAQMRENTPSSEEHSYRILGGPSVKLANDKVLLQFSAGGYYYSLELDDDLPKELGYDRKDLFLDSYGPAFTLDAAYKSCGMEFGANLHCLIDAKGFIREASSRGYAKFSLIELITGGPSTVDLGLYIFAEGRYFDLNNIAGAIDFDHDFRAGAQLVVELKKVKK